MSDLHISPAVESGHSMPLARLVHEVRPGGDWETWDDAEGALLTSVCLCCGQIGHYQQKIEAHLSANGLTEGVYIGEDGRVRDGHHRIIAARRLGIALIPLETREQAQERWVRDPGYVDWRRRKVGDVPDYNTLHWVTAALAEEQNDAR
jgi:hypothetical protein